MPHNHKRSPQAKFRQYIRDNAFFNMQTRETIQTLSTLQMEHECRRLFGRMVGDLVQWWQGEVLTDPWRTGSEEIDLQQRIEQWKDESRRPLVYGRQ